MKVAIVGAGGVGGYFGGRLAASGVDVHFLARGRHLEALRTQGLRLRSPLGDLHLPTVQATDDAAQVGPVDLVLFGVKLWDTEAAAAAVKPLLGPGTAVVSFQNGVVKDELLRQAVGPAHVLGGVCYIEAAIAEPGVIEHGGRMQRLVFGEYGGDATPRVQRFLDACRAAGIDADTSPDIGRTIWEKFVFLVGLSGSTTAVRAPIGIVRGTEGSRRLLRSLMAEAVAVGRAEGVALDAAFVDDRLAFCDQLPATMTSSMHRDLERGNRLELPWLSGDVARRGDRLGVPTPVNRTVADLLAPHVAGAARG
jgi:2-dehydropantoate 2-reductase